MTCNRVGPRHCQDILDAGTDTAGTFTIYPDGWLVTGLEVRCENGWMVSPTTFSVVTWPDIFFCILPQIMFQAPVLTIIIGIIDYLFLLYEVTKLCLLPKQLL